MSLDPFDEMSPFFQDEMIFYDEDKKRRQRRDDNNYCEDEEYDEDDEEYDDDDDEMYSDSGNRSTHSGTMKRKPVKSSHLVSVGYEDGTLEIEFRNGVYQYFDVPRDVYKELMTADSHGVYFHENIKNEYEWEKVEDDDDFQRDYSPNTPITHNNTVQPMPSPAQSISASTAPALFNAIRNGKPDVVRVLLRNNPKWVSARDQEGKTPLHYATAVNNVAIIQLLIKCKADVNARDNSGVSPLWQAISDGRFESAKSLIEFGADVNEKDKNDKSVYYLAKEKKVDIINMLVEYGAITYDDLWDALENGTVQDVRFFLENGEYDDDENYGWKPIHSAAMNSNVDVLKFLISKGADASARDDLGNTPFSQALARGYKEVVEYLIESGEKINGQYIYVDAFKCWEDTNEILNNRKYQDYDGNFNYKKHVKDAWETPLHIAARYGSMKVLEYLLSEGARVDAKNAVGNTPLSVANTEEKKYKLREAMVPKIPIWDAAINGQWETVKQYLIRDPLQIRITGTATIRNYICEKLTLLHLAVANNAHIEVCKFLFSHKANIHAKDNWDKTPLDYANTDEKKRSLLELLQQVTSIGAEDSNGNTPVHVTADSGQVDAVKFLGTCDVEDEDVDDDNEDDEVDEVKYSWERGTERKPRVRKGIRYENGKAKVVKFEDRYDGAEDGWDSDTYDDD